MKDPKIIAMINGAILSFETAKNYQKLSVKKDQKISFYLLTPIEEE